MWAKISNAWKPNQHKDDQSSSLQGDVLNKVKEQHPNMSLFHANESGVVDTPIAEPASPSVHSKRNMFKRLSKPILKEELSNLNAVPDLPNKVRGPKDSNGSQLSLNTRQTGKSTNSQTMPRRSSADMLRTSPPRVTPDTTRSVKDTGRRPSIDFLRHDRTHPSQDSINLADNAGEGDFNSPAFDKYASKRSILRDPNTPGTGQNVRFFPKDAFKVITPDQSLSTEIHDKPQPPLPKESSQFLDRLANSVASGSNSPSITHSSSSSKSRPSVAEIFSPLTRQENPAPNVEESDMSLSIPHPMVATEKSNLFDVSRQLEMPSFPPPGLGFDDNSNLFESNSLEAFANENSGIIDGLAGAYPNQMTSTPHNAKGKGKEKEEPSNQPLELPSPNPKIIDEAVFHAKDKSPRFSAQLHERSQSFSFGQSHYFSMPGEKEQSHQESEAAYPSSDLRPDSVRSSPAPTPPQGKNRSRAMSDTVFQSMLRVSTKSNPEPEADINDELHPVVYGNSAPEPDPFSANANTYYTAATMIPTTPPRGLAKHHRKTSKEESLIISLQTQLSLRTELCAQYENDLKARDELVEILEKKVTDFEKDEVRKKNALRSWKKKVQELEKVCRQLEEAIEDSRQESMERSVMDEASGEALRMLHRQIASLEREKGDWVKTEHALKEEVEALEIIARQREEEINNLKENLWNKDESERELNEGIRNAKEQIDLLGNMSLGLDEEELKKLLAEKDQKNAEDTQRFHMVEISLRQELEELKLKCEGLEVDKSHREEALDEVKQQLKARDEELATLKAELEAQWEHTEKATDKMLVLERERDEAVAERDAAKADLQELETRTSAMEVELNESEHKKTEMENELQEVWDIKDALEKEREELSEALQQEREHGDNLERELQNHNDQITRLQAEQQFSQDSIARLEENIRKRDDEIAHYTQRIRDQESELDKTHEELSSLRREYNRLINEQSRAFDDVTGQQTQMKAELDVLVKAKAEADVELKSNKDRVTALQSEVERLRRQIQTLQQESADKEVKMVQLSKLHSQAKEDMVGLNMALESKQQELELMKRKMAVKGTAGSTPAPASKTIPHRRDSSIFSATPISRPPSAMSDAVSDTSSTVKKIERRPSTDNHTPSAKIPALGKSIRINTIATNSTPSSTVTKARPSAEGSMGPPSMKARPSLISTPTPASGRISSLGRSSSAKAAASPVAPTHVPRRRVSSMASENGGLLKSKVGIRSPTASVPEQDEKENVDSSSTTSVRNRSQIPTPA